MFSFLGRSLVVNRYHHYGVESRRALSGLKSPSSDPSMELRAQFISQMRTCLVEHLIWRPKRLNNYLESSCRRNACTFCTDSFLSLTRHIEQGHSLLASCENNARLDGTTATPRLSNTLPTDWADLFEKNYPVSYSSIKSSSGGGPKYRCPHCSKLFTTVKNIQTHAAT